HLPQHRTEGIGVTKLPYASGIRRPQPIGIVRPAVLKELLEEAGGVAAGERRQKGAVLLIQHLDLVGTGGEAADGEGAGRNHMGTEDREGIRVARLDNGENVALRRLPARPFHVASGAIGTIPHADREPAFGQSLALEPAVPSYNGTAD